MDLGSFGVDQELEQADRLQQQALQLLQHAAQTHPWSQRSGDVSSASGMGSPAATVQEQPPSRRISSAIDLDEVVTMRSSAEDHAIALNPMDLVMRMQHDARQLDMQLGAKVSAASQKPSGQAPSASFLMEEQAKRIRATDIGRTPSFELRPLGATRPKPGCNGDTDSVRPGSVQSKPQPSADNRISATHGPDGVTGTSQSPLAHQVTSHGMPAATPTGSTVATGSAAMPEQRLQQPFTNDATAAAPTSDTATAAPSPPNPHSSHNSPAPPVGSASTIQMKIPHHLQSRDHRCAAGRTYPRSCQSASTNALHIFSPAATDGPNLAVPALIPESSPALASLPRPLQPLAPLPAIGSESGTASGTPSAATWQSLDHESSGAGSWASAALGSAAHDFQELLGMYFGLVSELRGIGIGVAHEPGASRPQVIVEDPGKIQFFADSEAVPAAEHAAGSAAGSAAGNGSSPVSATDDSNATPPQPDSVKAEGSLGGADSSTEGAGSPAASPAASVADAEDNGVSVGAGRAAGCETGMQAGTRGGGSDGDALAASLGGLMQRVRQLDFTARQLEVYMAAASMSHQPGGLGHVGAGGDEE